MQPVKTWIMRKLAQQTRNMKHFGIAAANTRSVNSFTINTHGLSIEDKEYVRLSELEAFQIFGTEPEPLFDDLAEIVRIRFDTPMAFISFVGRDTVHFKSKLGFDVPEVPREITFCDTTIASLDPLLIYDATTDERFQLNPFVTELPYVQFYAGAAIITPKGEPIGVVCAVDTIPRSPCKSDVQFLKGVAKLAMNALEIRRQSQELLELANRFGTITSKMEAVRDELDERCARTLARVMRHETI